MQGWWIGVECHAIMQFKYQFFLPHHDLFYRGCNRFMLVMNFIKSQDDEGAYSTPSKV